MNPLRLAAYFILSGILLIGCAHKSDELKSSDELRSRLSKEESQEKRGRSLRENGYAHYLKGDFPKAISQFEASILLDPQGGDSHWFRYLLYYCYLASGDYSSARTIAEALLREDPYHPLGYQQLGLAQLFLGQTALAVENFQRALEFESHSPRVHFYLGIAQAQLSREVAKNKSFSESEREYVQILKINSKDFTANYELAALYLYWNHSIATVPLLLSALSTNLREGMEEELSQDKHFYENYYLPVLEGILLYRRGDMKGSLKILLSTLANVPSGIRADLAEIYYYVGQIYLKLRNYDSAKTVFQKALELDPKGVYSVELAKSLRIVASENGSGLRPSQ